MNKKEYAEVYNVCSGMKSKEYDCLTLFSKRIKTTERLFGICFEYELLIEVRLMDFRDGTYSGDICIKLFDTVNSEWSNDNGFTRFNLIKHDYMKHSDFIQALQTLLCGNFREIIG